MHDAVRTRHQSPPHARYQPHTWEGTPGHGWEAEGEVCGQIHANAAILELIQRTLEGLLQAHAHAIHTRLYGV